MFDGPNVSTIALMYALRPSVVKLDAGLDACGEVAHELEGATSIARTDVVAPAPRTDAVLGEARGLLSARDSASSEAERSPGEGNSRIRETDDPARDADAPVSEAHPVIGDADEPAGERDTSANANTPPHSEADDRARPFPPSCSTLSQNHPRMACKGDVRAARMAGKSPPTSPMPHAKTSEIVMTRSVGSKEKTISDQLAMLIIENCTKPMSIEAAAPTAPPTIESITASSKNDESTLRRENPSARNVPISRWRLATAPYIVIIPPIIAPAAKKIDTTVPRTPTNVATPSDCFS